MKVKIYNKSNNELPKYKTTGAAGMDARASMRMEEVNSLEDLDKTDRGIDGFGSTGKQ